MPAKVEKSTPVNEELDDRKDDTESASDQATDAEPKQDGPRGDETPYQVDIADIKTSEPFASLFTRSPKVLESIEKDMQEYGFDAAHPLVLWNDVIVDGHCRYEVAKKLKLENVWVVVVDFEDEDKAIEYSIRSQRNRRNLTDADRFHLIIQLDKRETRGRKSQKINRDTNKAEDNANSGKSAQRTADLVDVSQSTVEHVRRIADKASPEVLDKVKNGEMRINEAYKTVAEAAPAKTTRKRKPGPDYKGALKALNQAIKCCDSDQDLTEAINKVVKKVEQHRAQAKQEEQAAKNAEEAKSAKASKSEEKANVDTDKKSTKTAPDAA